MGADLGCGNDILAPPTRRSDSAALEAAISLRSVSPTSPVQLSLLPGRVDSSARGSIRKPVE